jgi:hypothetical protein
MGNKLWSLLVFCFISSFVYGQSTLQDEIQSLESLNKKNQLKPVLLQRLAELYFLTSRCEDVKKILDKLPTEISCACGGKCMNNYETVKIQEFKTKMQKGKSWFSNEVKKSWQHVKHLPEARYWALKVLQKNTNIRIQKIRLEIEESLEGIEVSPR